MNITNFMKVEFDGNNPYLVLVKYFIFLKNNFLINLFFYKLKILAQP